MSLDDSDLLAGLYHDLATPPLSPTTSCHTRIRSDSPSPVLLLPSLPVTPIDPPLGPLYLDETNGLDFPTGSLLPTKLPPVLTRYILPPSFCRSQCCNEHARLPLSGDTDSLTREKKGKMPALSHLLSVGEGRVLALEADEKYVYAGCQSAQNEIVVSLFPPIAAGKD